jgi:hypothetical protein
MAVGRGKASVDPAWAILEDRVALSSRRTGKIGRATRALPETA